MFRFYWKLVKQLPRIVLDSTGRVADAAILFALAIAAVLAFINQPIAARVNDQWLGFNPLWGFVPIGLMVIYELLRTNYQESVKLQVERDDIHDRFERSQEPSLQVVRVIEQNLVPVGRGYAIEIQNLGGQDAVRCHGRIIALDLEHPIEGIGLSKWPVDRDLHWSGQVENATHYDVPGRQLAILNIVYCYPAEGVFIAALAYRAPEEFRTGHKLPTQYGTILALVRLSNEGHNPVNMVFRLNPLALTTWEHRVLGEQPFELLWNGTDDVTLQDFVAKVE